MTEFKLGSFLTDRGTGFKGFATCRTELISGSVQYGLQPQVGDDGVMKEAIFVDVQTLAASAVEALADVAARVVEPIEPPSEPLAVPMGSELLDKVTGIKGILVERTTFINGCVYFSIQPKAAKGSKETKAPAPVRGGWRSFSVEGQGLSQDVVVVAEQATAPIERRGGPMRSVGMLRRA